MPSWSWTTVTRANYKDVVGKVYGSTGERTGTREMESSGDPSAILGSELHVWLSWDALLLSQQIKALWLCLWRLIGLTSLVRGLPCPLAFGCFCEWGPLTEMGRMEVKSSLSLSVSLWGPQRSWLLSRAPAFYDSPSLGTNLVVLLSLPTFVVSVHVIPAQMLLEP